MSLPLASQCEEQFEQWQQTKTTEAGKPTKIKAGTEFYTLLTSLDYFQKHIQKSFRCFVQIYLRTLSLSFLFALLHERAAPGGNGLAKQQCAKSCQTL